jgi:signal transduction histidine kinase
LPVKRVQVRIVDSGPGIPEEHLPGLFERGSPLRKTASKHQGGGLGLLIARRILELHGCSIGASNNRGTGATFEFELPVVARPLNSNLSSAPVSAS